jgi:hypothetical protein
MVLRPFPGIESSYTGYIAVLLLLLVISALLVSGCTGQARTGSESVPPQVSTTPAEVMVTAEKVVRMTPSSLTLHITPVSTDLLKLEPGSPIVVQSASLFINGTARGHPSSGIRIWIFGNSKIIRATVPVESDGAFSYELLGVITENLYSGQYFVVVQHPGPDDYFNIDSATFDEKTQEAGVIRQYTSNDKQPVRLFKIWGSGSLAGSQAAEAVIRAIDDESLDDTCATDFFFVEKPWFRIDPVFDKHKGDRINFSSTTNLPPGIAVEYGVVQTPHSPSRRVIIMCNGTALITGGSGGENNLFYECDTSDLPAIEYDIYEWTADRTIDNYSRFYLLPPVDASGNLVAIRPKNYITWERLDLPDLKVNASMKPVLPTSDLYRNNTETWPHSTGRIKVYSPEGVVRIFDKDGIQIAAYYDVGGHGGAVPSGAMVSIDNGTNVSTVYYLGERWLTEIFE